MPVTKSSPVVTEGEPGVLVEGVPGDWRPERRWVGGGAVVSIKGFDLR